MTITRRTLVGSAAAGVRVSSCITSSIRATEIRVCCQASNTWESCWIGLKNMST